MEVTVYTDASYCDRTKYAACGYIVAKDGNIMKHTVVKMSNVSSSGEAEAFAATFGLQYCFLMEGIHRVFIYTDCEAVVYKFKGTKNVQGFVELDETIELYRDYGIKVKAIKIKGHKNDSTKQKYRLNNAVDRACRCYLNIMRGEQKNQLKLREKEREMIQRTQSYLFQRIQF